MKSAFVYTFGCKVNQYDSQLLKDALKRNGYLLAENPEDADICVINSCTVTGEADRQVRQLARKLINNKKPTDVILTGCYPKTLNEPVSVIDGITCVKDINVFLKFDAVINAITQFEGHSRAFVKVQDGCDAFCTYCIVPYARSKIFSKPIDNVVCEVENLVENGYSEIVLSGIRLGKYAFGLNRLLKKLIAVNKEFRIRLSSLELKEVDTELIGIIKDSGKVCRHIHIPLQSGSDRILKLMNRPYNSSEFFCTIETIMSSIKNLAVTTDIMVGFPSETGEDLQQSVDLVKKIAFSKLHVFKYSARPGTKAFEMPGQLTNHIKKSRSAELIALGKSLEQQYLKQNYGHILSAVLENNRMILTDNYLHLKLAEGNLPKSKLFNIKVSGDIGYPSAELICE